MPPLRSRPPFASSATFRQTAARTVSPVEYCRRARRTASMVRALLNRSCCWSSGAASMLAAQPPAAGAPAGIQPTIKERAECARGAASAATRRRSCRPAAARRGAPPLARRRRPVRALCSPTSSSSRLARQNRGGRRGGARPGNGCRRGCWLGRSVSGGHQHDWKAAARRLTSRNPSNTGGRAVARAVCKSLYRSPVAHWLLPGTCAHPSSAPSAGD